MAETDLIKWTKIWYSSTWGIPESALRDDDVKLDRLKSAVVNPPNFTRVYSNPGTPTTNTNIKIQKTCDDNAVGQVCASRNSDIIGKVTLTDGVTKGLNRLLPLSLAGSAVRDYLGNSLKINLGQRITELKNDKMTISVALEGGTDGFSATALAKKVKSKEEFKCTVSLKGHVIIAHNGQFTNQGIGEVIRDLKEKDVAASMELRMYTFSNKEEVNFPLIGEIEFLYDYEQNVTWSN